MARNEDTIFIGGLFSQVGGQARAGIAAIDARAGALLPWNISTDNGMVDALLVSGDSLYVGGAFGAIGGQPRRALASIDLRTGLVTSWRPELTEWDVINPRVQALAIADSTLYVGGDFGAVGGEPLVCLAAIDTRTGLPAHWSPGLNGLVWCLLRDGGALYAGGGFDRAGGVPASGLAAFSLTPSPPPLPASLELARCFPNPVHSNTQVQFELPWPASVTLSVYDVQGRRVVVALDRLMSAGQHSVRIETEGWRERGDGKACGRGRVRDRLLFQWLTMMAFSDIAGMGRTVTCAEPSTAPRHVIGRSLRR